MMVSVDGYVEDADGKIDWHVWNEEMEAYMLDFFEGVDTLVFGRKTYELMQAYWPTEAGSESPRIAAKMNSMPKIVFSSTLSKATWPTTMLMHEVDKETIMAMKNQPGKDIVIFGGASLARSFAALGLIDTYQLFINPVILGGGSLLFGDSDKVLSVKLVATKSFNCGNVLLTYQPVHVHGDDRDIQNQC